MPETTRPAAAPSGTPTPPDLAGIPDPSELITLAEAARLLPSRRRGARVSIPTLWRWATARSGPRLETWVLGRSRYTTRHALTRYIAECSSRSAMPATTHPPVTERSSRHAETREVLARARIIEPGGMER